MSRVDLLSPVLEGGIRNTHFFNGRLLTAEDLRTEQDAGRQQRAQLGRALGEGVVHGLEVRIGNARDPLPTVWVTAGLAFNREGQALALPEALREVEVALVRSAAQALSAEAGLFAVCQPPESTAVPGGTGVYLFVLSPASGFQERAPKVGLGDAGAARGCGSRYAVEGVQFRLIELPVSNPSFASSVIGVGIRGLLGQAGAGRVSRLRNLLAHFCLGTDAKADFARDLYRLLVQGAAALRYGPFDALRAQRVLNDCDVPLALIYWTASGIQFADGWAVRRRLHRPLGAAAPPFPAADRQQAEAEAAFLQFQHQVLQMTGPTASPAGLARVRARDFFGFLPAAGMLPVASGAFPRGFNPARFFEGQKVEAPVYMEGDKIRPLLEQSFAYPPIDLSSDELIRLYEVRENRTGARGAQPYLVFAHGRLPYFGAAQFDLSHWNESHYTSSLEGQH